MKSLYPPLLIILASIFSFTTYAQHTTRTIGKSSSRNNGTSWVIQDSVTFKYASGNNSTGGHKQYIEQSLMCDTIYSHQQLSPGIWTTTNMQVNYPNSNGVKDSAVYLIKNSSGVWVRYIKYNYRYNTNNDIAEVILQYYDSTAKVYNNSQRTAYSYAGRNITEMLTQYFVSGSWVNFNRFRNTYTGINLTLAETEDYNTLTTMWNPASKARYVYTAGRTGGDFDSLIAETYAAPPTSGTGFMQHQIYDVNGDPVTANGYNWNFITAKWEIQGRSQKIFNSNRQKIIDTLSGWNAATSSFEYQNIQLYQYNNYGVIDSQTTLIWNPATTAFRNANLSTRRYNADTFHTEMQFYDWSYTDNKWSENNSMIVRYYYEAVPLNINNVPAQKALFNLYPNPANDVLNISMNNTQGKSLVVRMYNTTGTLVHQREIAGNTGSNYSIPIHYLQPGMYTVVVSCGTESGAAQFVINR